MADPLTPAQALELAKRVADVYSTATAELVRIVARRVARGVPETRNTTTRAQLSELVKLRRDAQAVVARAQSAGPDRMARIVAEAYRGGLRPSASGLTAVNQRAVQQLAGEAVRSLDPTGPRMLRWADDVYRAVTADTVGLSVAGSLSRREATARALDRYAAMGVTGFTDTAGANWRIESYAEMAARTATGRAHLNGTLDHLVEQGRDLVIVSNSPAECPLCRPYEGQIFSLSGTDPRYPSLGMASGLFHPNCFPGEVPVSAPSGVCAADSRWYEGELVVVHTAGGDELPVTPNHPVLTPEGWVSAGELVVGQHILRYLGEPERVHGVRPDHQNVEVGIGEVYETLRQTSPMGAVSVPAAPEQFHSDGADGEVHVVLADGLLWNGHEPTVGDGTGELQLLAGGVRLPHLLGRRPLDEVGLDAGHPSHRVMGGSDEHRPFLGGHSLCAAHRGAGAADLSPTLEHPSRHGGLSDPESGREVVLALSGQVTLDEVILLSRREFAGHVYNLQTKDGWYAAGGIVVHNCTHTVSAYVEGLTRPRPADSNPEGYRLRQRQRELERRVRESRRRVAAAEEIGDQKVLLYNRRLLGRRQGDLGVFLRDNGLKHKAVTSSFRTQVRV